MSEQEQTLSFASPEDIRELKKLYEEALRTGEEVFIFQGKEMLTAYAKYLIQYLEGA